MDSSRRGAAIAPPPGLYTAAASAPTHFAPALYTLEPALPLEPTGPLYCPFSAIQHYEPHRPIPLPIPPPPPLQQHLQQQHFWPHALLPPPQPLPRLQFVRAAPPGAAPLPAPAATSAEAALQQQSYASGGGLGFSAAASAGEGAPAQPAAALRLVQGGLPGEQPEKRTRWALS